MVEPRKEQTMKYITYRQYGSMLEKLTTMIKTTGKTYSGVYGIPRGGVALALHLSHNLEIPYLLNPCRGCLVVDDIADSGKTLSKYVEFECATLIYKDKSVVMPGYYIAKEPELKWIVFPWEKK